MGSSLRQWESDPLFSAAEVVQDSADRMESLFRLLLHEQSLVNCDHPDPRLLSSIEYHKRDLATILGTAKWQLEDFERAICSSAMMDKCHMREDVISRHGQFIGAIREQINHVEKSFKEPSIRKSSEWVNLNEQDRDGLALFLSGGNPTEHISHHDSEASTILRRFLDPTTASTSKDAGIIQPETRELQTLNINGAMHAGHYSDSMKESNLRKGTSHYSTKLGLDSSDSLLETTRGRQVREENWDLEANEAKPGSSFHRSKLRRLCGRVNIFFFLNNLWHMYGSRIIRNYTKRMKDGEEQSSSSNVSHASQEQNSRRISANGDGTSQELCLRLLNQVMSLYSQLGACRAGYHRFPCQACGQYSLQITLTIVLIVILIGILVFQIG